MTTCGWVVTAFRGVAAPTQRGVVAAGEITIFVWLVDFEIRRMVS
jgi:hypothetical protein